MIYVDIKGNLGNQMFEYALARSLQEKSKQEIVLNTTLLQRYKPEYSFNLDVFKLNNQVIVENNKLLPWYMNTYRKGFIRIIKGLMPKIFFRVMSWFGVYIFLKDGYVDFIEKVNHRNYYLCGYWQSTKYFDDIRPILVEEFTSKYDRLESNNELYEVIENTESICVTVRCGDYLSNEKYRKLFLVCTPEYYQEGVKNIKKEFPHATVCVFSDDINWCKQNLEFGEKVYYETGNDPLWEKLRMMSLCKHFVISNSTFSWWAQYLSENENKIVYAPKPWFPDNRSCDIYQPEWRYIKL